MIFLPAKIISPPRNEFGNKCTEIIFPLPKSFSQKLFWGVRKWFGRCNNNFGEWENYFDKWCKNYFGEWEIFLGCAKIILSICSHWLGYLDCLATACQSRSSPLRKWIIPSTSSSSLSLSLIQFSSSSSYSSTLLSEVRRGRLVNWFSKHFQQPRSWVFNYLVLSWPITVNSIICPCL